MNIIRSLSIALLASLASARSELLIYEPFDYAPVNDEVFGRLAGSNGGLGFAAPWQDTEGGDSFIYDQRGNPEALYAGGWGAAKPDWDGVVDNLPTMGGYVGVSDWSSGGESFNAQRKLATSAGEMAARNGGVLWLSAVWHFPDSAYFTPVGIALTPDGGGFVERAIKVSNNGNTIGGGNGESFRNGMKRLNPMFWEKGKDTAKTAGTDISTKLDNVVILKFEFGATDTVRAWFFTEDQKITEKEFEAKAVACSSSIDENTLDTLAFTTIRRSNAVDGFRIATTFQDVISGSIPARQEVKIAQQLHDKKSDRYFLSWTINPGETYGIHEPVDAGGYKPCIAAAVVADPKARQTTIGPFANPHPGNPNLKFEIGLPDLTNSAITRVWGKAFILAGQSNMVGRGQFDKGQGDEIGGGGSLREQVEKDPANYGYLLDEKKRWKKPSNMKFWWNRADLGGGPRVTKGDLTVGYGSGPDCIGPEFGFGWALHEIYQDQPVLLIKTA